MLLGSELLDLGGNEVIVYPALTSVPLDIGKLVDSEGVLLVERRLVELPNGGGGFTGSGKFDKGKPGENRKLGTQLSTTTFPF